MSDEPTPYEPESAAVSMEVEVDESALSFPVSESYTLESFAITGVDVVPGVSANVYVVIAASNGRSFTRTVKLAGDAYAAWTVDAYLYAYVRENIGTIFSP